MNTCVLTQKCQRSVSALPPPPVDYDGHRSHQIHTRKATTHHLTCCMPLSSIVCSGIVNVGTELYVGRGGSHTKLTNIPTATISVCLMTNLDSRSVPFLSLVVRGCTGQKLLHLVLTATVHQCSLLLLPLPPLSLPLALWHVNPRIWERRCEPSAVPCVWTIIGD